jgi:CheY-like chemotaxis protein
MARSTYEHKVLVVDDSEISCAFVQAALGDRGFQVIAMTTPFGFVKTIRQERPDLILVDVTMPSLSGPKLIELALKKRIHVCPIVLYSDRPEEELARLAAACGASGYIQKASDERRLQREVKRFLPQARLGP